MIWRHARPVRLRPSLFLSAWAASALVLPAPASVLAPASGALRPANLPRLGDPLRARGEARGEEGEPSGSGSEEEVFGLSLEEALNLALQNNYGLEIEQLATDIARFNFEGSWGAFDPVVDVGTNYREGENEITDSDFPTTVAAIEDQQLTVTGALTVPLTTGGQVVVDLTSFRLDSYNAFTDSAFTLGQSELGVSYRQPLLRGAWSKSATTAQRESELQYYRQRERNREVRQQLLLDVHNAYWDLVASLEELGVRRVAVQLGEQQLDQDERRLDVGVGTEVDVLQSETNVATEEQALLRATTNVEGAADALKALLFRRADEESLTGYRAWWDRRIQPTTSLPEVENPALDWTRSLAVGLEQRSALVQQRLEIEAAGVRLQRAVSDRRAALDLTASLRSRGEEDGLGDSLSESLEFGFLTTQVGLEYSRPLRNTLAARAESAARAAVRLARLTYDQVETQVVADVRNAVRNVDFQGKAVAAAEKSVDLARRQLEAEQARYKEGLSTTFQVLQFQQQLSQALSSEASARAGYAKSLANLQRAEGRLGEAELPGGARTGSARDGE